MHTHTHTQVKHTHTWRANAAAPTCVIFPPDSIAVCYLFSTIFTLRLFLSVRQRYILVTLIKCSFGSMSSHHTPYWLILFIIPISTRRNFLFSLSLFVLFSLTYLLSICFSACYVTTIKKKRKQQHDLQCYPHGRNNALRVPSKVKTITERELAMLTGNYDVIVLYRYRCIRYIKKGACAASIYL